MLTNDEFGKRIEYAIAEAKNLEKALVEARRVAGNVATVVSEVTPEQFPLSLALTATRATCELFIDGALREGRILSKILSGAFPNARSWIPLLLSKSDMLYGIKHDLARAVEATKAAQCSIYSDSYGAERDEYAKAVSGALTILEVLLRQIDPDFVEPESLM